MNITVIEESNVQQWNKSLSMFSASPFITAAWLESFRTSHRVPIYFRFVSEGNTIGAIAGLILKPSHSILRKINRPIFFFSGPAVLQSDKELIRTCILTLTKYAKIHGYTHLDLKSWDYPYVYDLGNLPFYKDTRGEFIINLQREFADIKKTMRRMIKSKVKKAQKNGLTFHESSSPELIPDLVSLLEETRSIRLSKGYENYSYYYISYLNEEVISKLLMNEIAKIFYIKEKDHILCAQLTAAYDQRVYGVIMGSSCRGYELGANALIWYNAIEKFHKEGYKTFNLGGVADDAGASGLIFFKTSLGAEKHICVGGSTCFLQGCFFNLLHQVYYKKLSFKTMKKVFDGWITRRGDFRNE